MRRWDSERGGSKLGCTFSVFLIITFGYVAFRVIPIYQHHSEFQTRVEQEVGRAGAKQLDDEVLKKNIMNAAAVNQIPLKQEDLQIVRATSQIAADVKYSIKVDFPFYTHVFDFKFRATSVVGAL